MGLAASQTRFLTLTARQSDLEYQSQQICNSRLQLSSRLEEIATEYTNAQSSRNLFTSGFSPLKYQQLSTTNLAQAGLQIIEVKSGELFENYTPPVGEYKKSIEDGLRDGTYILAKPATDFSQSTVSIPTLTGNYETLDWRTNPDILDDLFTADDSKAEDTYDKAVSEIQQKDKTLTLQLQKIDTEHKAIESEVEAIKKVIQSSTESSFKTFA